MLRHRRAASAGPGAGERLERQRQRRVVGVRQGLQPTPGSAVYTASKGAGEQITRVLAGEPGTRGITVNPVLPGATDTEMPHGVSTEESRRLLVRLTHWAAWASRRTWRT